MIIIIRLIINRLKSVDTYVVAFVIGAIINLYGQIIVPLLRGDPAPLTTVANEYHTTPLLFIASALIAFLFPFFVGIFSSVRAEYKLRHAVSKSTFPDDKPDPVFRAKADSDGHITLAGRKTEVFLTENAFKTAPDVFGQDVWQSILSLSKETVSEFSTIQAPIDACNEDFLISYSRIKDGMINLYMTRIVSL